jgi:hypothetical protein
MCVCLQESRQGGKSQALPENRGSEVQGGKYPAGISQRSAGVSQLEIEPSGRQMTCRPASQPGPLTQARQTLGGLPACGGWGVSQMGVHELEILSEGCNQCPGLTAQAGEPPRSGNDSPLQFQVEIGRVTGLTLG